MHPEALTLLVTAIFVVALLYSTVGHGGASGYIAVLALAGLAPELLKPTALILNIGVSAIAAGLFWRAGYFSWRLFWPFAVTSIPASCLGGYLTLPPQIYRPLLGFMLLLAALRLVLKPAREGATVTAPPILQALLIGAGFGLLSGLTGIGGGIFLSPLLILCGWGRAKEVSGVAALFILVNSGAGLIGHLSHLPAIPAFTPLLTSAAVLGGMAGASLGSRVFPARTLIHALSLVLVMAGIKLMVM